jgi:hypothetical protein
VYATDAITRALKTEVGPRSDLAWLTRYVADGENVLDARAHLPIDLDVPALIDLDAGGFDTQPLVRPGFVDVATARVGCLRSYSRDRPLAESSSRYLPHRSSFSRPSRCR